MVARDDAGGGTGSARRRRERRLRSHLRHERMAIAMALAESTHHSAQRQEMARAGGRGRVAGHGEVPEELLPLPGTRHVALLLRRRQRAGARWGAARSGSGSRAAGGGCAAQ